MYDDKSSIIFQSPFHGTVLITGSDGILVKGRLKINVRLKASPCSSIKINGIKTIENNGNYSGDIFIDGFRNQIEAKCETTGTKEIITVFWFKNAFKKYRFTVDDFIIAFEDIHINQEKYTSIFQNPYLKIFYDAHCLYNSKVHINTFYQNIDNTFNLSMMTDKFKNEFTANADWLSITFHAISEFPDKPYENAGYEKVLSDCILVTNEIRRFAGDAVLRNTTTLHWGTANIYGTRALRVLGFKALNGFFNYNENNQPYVSYYLTSKQLDLMGNRTFYVDVDEDIIFARLPVVLNAPDLTADKVAPYLDTLSSHPHKGDFIQMVIHEQYFYPEYPAYESDYRERIMNMAKWMKNHDYKCVSLTDIIQEEL